MVDANSVVHEQEKTSTTDTASEIKSDLYLQAKTSFSNSLQQTEQSTQAKKSILKRGLFWAIAIGLIVVIAATIAFACMLVSLPNCVGQTPLQAQEVIAGESTAWKIAFISEDGDPLDSGFDLASEDYEVKWSTPDVGTLLNRFDSSVVISFGVGESAKSIRRKAIQEKIDAYIADGCASVDYFDDGSFVAFNVYSPHDSSMVPVASRGSDRQEDLEELESFASSIEADIIEIAYTSDGFLSDTYIATWQGATEEQQEKTFAYLVDTIDDACDFGRKNRTSYLDKLTSTIRNGEKNWSDAHWGDAKYVVGNDAVSLYLYSSSPGNPNFGSPDNAALCKDQYERAAAAIATALALDAATIYFYSSDYIPFVDVPQVSYVRES